MKQPKRICVPRSPEALRRSEALGWAKRQSVGWYRVAERLSAAMLSISFSSPSRQLAAWVRIRFHALKEAGECWSLGVPPAFEV
jgi:hypothetical protein